MPIYEYRCADCSADFDLLVRSDTTPACPHCGGASLVRKISLPARPAGAAGAQPDFSKLGPPPGGGCCGGSCHCH